MGSEELIFVGEDKDKEGLGYSQQYSHYCIMLLMTRRLGHPIEFLNTLFRGCSFRTVQIYVNTVYSIVRRISGG
jgi:hypothetical protein